MLISVRVVTGAKNERVKKVTESRFEIAIREKPENNAANRRVRELIASYFNRPRSGVRIMSGHRRPSKVLSVALP